MSKYILGKKIGMTQIFDENGNAKPVTIVEAGPVTVTKLIDEKKDGYSAVQVGFGVKRLNKPQQGQQKGFVSDKHKGFAFLKELKTPSQELKLGDKLSVSQFELNDEVVVRGTTKGRGFQGVVKRWGFHGGPKSHGQKHTLRAPGSIGSAFPQRVFKGLKMAGHMGVNKKSVINLRVAYIDEKNNLLGIVGSVPGTKGSMLEIIKR